MKKNDFISLGGPNPYIPVGLPDEKSNNDGNSSDASGGGNMKRARVLCSYDASGSTELNLTANEVIFVSECNPPNPDYMYGKQGLLKGLVPRAFLEMLDE
ncbi:hypothetical protein DMENIID0001_088860 [Sergentomyia squamirostris]